MYPLNHNGEHCIQWNALVFHRRALKKSPPKPRESPAEQNRGSPSTSDALIHLDSSDDEVSKSQVASEDVSSQRRSSGVKRPLLCDSDRSASLALNFTSEVDITR